MSVPARRESLVTRAFVLASIANFLNGLALHLYLHLPGFLHDLHADEVQIGAIFALMSVAAILVRPFVGWVMDRRGRRAVIVSGSLLHLAACLGFLLVDRLGLVLLVVRFTQGVAAGMLFSSLFTYAADIVPEGRRTEGLALFGVSGMLPIAMGGILGDALLASGGGYARLFLLSAICAAAGLAASLPLRDVHPGSDRAPARGFLASLLQRDLMPLWFIGSAFATAQASVLTFLKTFVELTSLGSVGLFWGTYTAAAVALRLGLGWLPERVGPKRILPPALVAQAAGLILLAWGRSDLHVAAAGVLAGIGHGYAFPILSGLVVGRARPSERGAAMSMFTAVFDVGIVAGGPLLGLIIRASSYSTMFVVAASISALGLFTFSLWDRGR